jgi:hypothetical protein
MSILLIVPLIPARVAPLDLFLLQSNCINLVATAGTMATLSLAFIFEKIKAVTPSQFVSRLCARILSISSILYLLFASLAGLIYEIQGSSMIFIQILFWYTIFGITCLTATAVILFLSHTEVMI